jgi:hypothetical protein
VIVVIAAIALVVTERAQSSTIQGHISGSDGKPVRGVQVVLKRQDTKAPPVSVATDAQGNYVAGRLPVGTYRINIRINGKDAFSADKLNTRVGDPLRVEYDMEHAIVTISDPISKKTRRFAWRKAGTGSPSYGRWVETYALYGGPPD